MQFLDEINSKDAFVICGRGLLYSYQQLILDLFSDKKQFVLHLNSQTNAPLNRAPLYLQGGIVSFSSTAVLLDLLNCVLPVDKLSGVIVTDAHRYIQ